MEFLPLSRRRSFSRNIPGGGERGETDVFAGYVQSLYTVTLNEKVKGVDVDLGNEII